ncbi:MAG: TldD/PmbA family protein [Clostridia bacterium]|nr:TldD/PmbA family protein [Clostridia bacterium]
MLDMLLDVLKASGASAWEVTDLQETGWEFYFIRHRLDQNRAKKVEHITVKVYQKSEDGQFLGSASGEIPPTASRAEAEKLVGDLLLSASFVRNPAYSLRSGSREEPRRSAADVRDSAARFIRTLNSLLETPESDLNSYEIFTSEVTRRFVTSEGIDVTSVYPSSMVEAVVNARDAEHEIELYRLYHSGSCDENQLSRDLTETMRYGLDKLKTAPTPALGQVDVVFSTDAALEIYDWFLMRTNTAFLFQRISDWTVGKAVCDAPTGDRLTLKTVRELPNSSSNAAYDNEGAPVRDLTLIEDGVVKAHWGSRQFSQYMGEEDCFLVGNVEVSGGTADEDGLRQGDFMEIVEFSDFQVSALNGDVAGEIRLAYWHHGGEVTPVSGGSISGSMADYAPAMRASRAQRQYNDRLIPSVTRLYGVKLAGVEQDGE